jgi:hypothetical protein
MSMLSVAPGESGRWDRVDWGFETSETDVAYAMHGGHVSMSGDLSQ